MSRRAPHRTTRPRTGSLPRLPAGPAGRALAAVVAATVLAVAAQPAGAERVARQAETTEPAPSSTTTTVPGEVPEAELPPLGELPEVSPGLAEVALRGDGYDEAVARRDELAEDRAAAVRRAADEDEAIAAGAAREADLTEQIDAARARAERWEDEADRLDDLVRAVAVDSYMSGTGDDVGPLFSLDTDAHDRAATSSVTSETLARRQIRELEHAQAEGRRARSDETLSTAIRQGVRDALATDRVERDEARADAERLAIAVDDAALAVEDNRRLAEVVGADFPLVVLDAYWKAAETMRLLAPGCGISWWAMAGIGKIESRHGTYGGADVRADGSLTKPIIGIPLTGSNGTASIGDSDGGLIDGDPTVDRAAGPMQFIPQTWAAYGVDGDQNGRIEIQNIYDAAASAARYLCAAAGSMADTAGLQRGYFAYNHSTEYVASVLSQAIRYGTDVVIEGVPLPPAAPPPPPAPIDPAAPADGTTTTAPTATTAPPPPG